MQPYASPSNQSYGSPSDQSQVNQIDLFNEIEELTSSTSNTSDEFSEFDLHVLKEVAEKLFLNTNDESDYVSSLDSPQSTGGMNIYTNEFSPYGDSSGYGSSTSTPSNSPAPSNNSNNSPPNSFYEPNNFITESNIPVTILEIQEQQKKPNSKIATQIQQKIVKKCVPILPKPDSTYASQKHFYKFLLTKEKEHIIKRFFVVVNKIPLENFSQQDKEGDT
jgi:hypothetical protein